jgi:S1-C subfamily serine protease
MAYKELNRVKLLFLLVGLLLVLQVASYGFLFYERSRMIDYFNNLTSFNYNKLSNAVEEYNARSQSSLQELSNIIAKQQTSVDSFQQQISQLQSQSGDFSSVIQDAIKSVVFIRTDKAIGSGFFMSSDGYIVTNAHVIENANRINALTSDRSSYDVQLVGIDELRDIALLKASGNFEFLEFADSSQLQLGKKVVAIGNPLGLSFTVTEGIISGLDRKGTNGLSEYIQTDVSLNPGNSGGPLIDSSGKAVGINNFKLSNAEGIGFALESNAIKRSVDNLMK